VAGAVALVSFLPALALGSFLNVVAARVPAGLSIVRPGSACPGCKHPIAPYDNIPLVSYLLLRGRCRTCRAPISWRYPAVELTTALLISGCFLRFGAGGRAVVASIFCATLVAVSITDLERRIIPNKIVLPAALIVLVGQTLVEPSPEWAIAGVAASAGLLLTALAYPAGMGMGDVKLALLLGVALGRTVPVALLLGMIAALVPSAVLFARHGSRARKMAIPFGPFLALGGVVALFAGHELLRAYLTIY
jgi:leader peptidase (prepilin peptidase) / N-methyltransferase